MTWKPDIFAYIDYRTYMRDYYELAKQHTKVVSYRYLARRAGFSSPNFIKLVMDGQRNLGPESVESVAKAFDLDTEEARFFEMLVAFVQAGTPELKSAAFEELASIRRFRSARRIETDMFEYLSHWYYPAIRELAARPDFQMDADWVSKQLWPRVPQARVRRALELLVDMELLRVSEDGSVSRGEPSLTTGHEVGSLAIGNFHRQMMAQAANSIESVARERRDISGLTACIPVELVGELKKRIHQFRESMLELCDSSTDGRVVYQLNVQLFPLSDESSDE